MARLFLKPVAAVAKTAVPVLAPTLGLANAVIRLGSATGPVGGVFLAISLIAEECTPPAVYYSGKCITAFACYVGDTVTCNLVWSGAGTSENIIDLLTIEDNQKRREKFERGLKNADEHQVLLANAYMRLAEKNRDENFKKHSRFLKISPQYFAMNLMLQFNLRILMQHFLATPLYLIL